MEKESNTQPKPQDQPPRETPPAANKATLTSKSINSPNNSSSTKDTSSSNTKPNDNDTTKKKESKQDKLIKKLKLTLEEQIIDNTTNEIQVLKDGRKHIHKGNRDGRPKRTLDFKLLANLCQIHCTREEIYNSFNINRETLDNLIKERFGVDWETFYQQKREGGKKSIRRKQIELALRGDRVMLIWLGKNMLGQADQQKVDHTTKGEKLNITVNISDEY